MNPDVWFARALSRFASDLYEATGKSCLLEVALDAGVALHAGILPGESAQIATQVGYVTVRSVERRAIPRTFCKAFFCNLPAEHPGEHRGPCGCIKGCAAEGCPNKPLDENG